MSTREKEKIEAIPWAVRVFIPSAGPPVFDDLSVLEGMTDLSLSPMAGFCFLFYVFMPSLGW
jgi:hypothetical protein